MGWVGDDPVNGHPQAVLGELRQVASTRHARDVAEEERHPGFAAPQTDVVAGGTRLAQRFGQELERTPGPLFVGAGEDRAPVHA